MQKPVDWLTKGVPSEVSYLKERLFGERAEFLIGTALIIETASSIPGEEPQVKVALFNGRYWEITGEPGDMTSPRFIDRLRNPRVLSVELLEPKYVLEKKESNNELRTN